MMSDLNPWQEGNNHYVAAALAWLTSRLQVLAGDSPELEHAIPHPQAVAMEPPPALILLSRQLGLSPFEQEVLLLCAALEWDTRIAALCARAQDDPSRPYPTFALALALFDDPAWDALSPERPLRYWRLLEIHQPGYQPLIACPLRADERVVHYLKGLNHLDERLASLVLPMEPIGGMSSAETLAGSHRAAVATIRRHLEQAPAGRRLPIIYLLGPATDDKQAVAWHAAAELGLNLYRLT